MKKELTVVTNGCFDILHVGHIRLLQEAKGLGDKLIVLINSDESVKRLKGDSRPINCLAHRIEMLKSIKWVDEVIAFDEDTPYNAILQLKPDVLVKGGDYDELTIVGSDIVMDNGGMVVIIPLVDDVSTTIISNRLNNL
jgi:D-beta-D-heptose 7-phosphate kinase / D-beta-D-heptose 1-phosphate adenosyltransferase